MLTIIQIVLNCIYIVLTGASIKDDFDTRGAWAWDWATVVTGVLMVVMLIVTVLEAYSL